MMCLLFILFINVFYFGISRKMCHHNALHTVSETETALYKSERDGI